MKPGQNRKARDADPLARTQLVLEATMALLLEAARHCIQSKIDDCIRKWLGHLEADIGDRTAEELAASAMMLAIELGVYTPSLSGTRPIDRLARSFKPGNPEEATALAALGKSRFRLFRILSIGPDDCAKAEDLANAETFLLFDPLLSALATGREFAARVAPLEGGLHIATGPKIPLDPASLAVAQEFIRPGKGLVNDQRCAAAVYRHAVRHGSGEAGLFGAAQDAGADGQLSYPDELLDGLALQWMQRAAAAEASPGELEAARGLTSGRRLAAALVSSVELRGMGKTRLADIYRHLALIQMETLHRRSQVGSGEANPLETLRATLENLAASKLYPNAAAALFTELHRRLTLVSGSTKAHAEDLGRIIDRIRGLRAKTIEQGCTEQEALAAAKKVAEMLERYGLSLSEVEMQQQPCEGFGIDTRRRKHAPVDRCPPAIAHFCDCRTWSELSPGGTIRFIFFGLSADVEAAHFLYDLIASAFETETLAFRAGDIFANMVGAQKRSAITSFQIGLAKGINGKLNALKTERSAAVFKSTGRDLVPIKTSITEVEFEKLGLNLTSRNASSRSRVITDAYEAGQVAGRKFEIQASLA